MASSSVVVFVPFVAVVVVVVLSARSLSYHHLFIEVWLLLLLLGNELGQ